LSLCQHKSKFDGFVVLCNRFFYSRFRKLHAFTEIVINEICNFNIIYAIRLIYPRNCKRRLDWFRYDSQKSCNATCCRNVSQMLSLQIRASIQIQACMPLCFRILTSSCRSSSTAANLFGGRAVEHDLWSLVLSAGGLRGRARRPRNPRLASVPTSPSLAVGRPVTRRPKAKRNSRTMPWISSRFPPSRSVDHPRAARVGGSPFPVPRAPVRARRF
jgi:hypothetical protein